MPNEPIKKSGWVNIQCVHTTDKSKSVTSYYTGADIHETKELAKKHATSPTIAQMYIEFEVS